MSEEVAPAEERTIVTSTCWRCECGCAQYLLIERSNGDRLSWCIECYDEDGNARR